MSDWKQQAARRRDARNAKDPAPRQAGGGKSTKRWCRGKVGIEHKPKCVRYDQTKLVDRTWYADWRLLVCETCGKEIDTYFPCKWSEREKPEWVTE